MEEECRWRFFACLNCWRTQALTSHSQLLSTTWVSVTIMDPLKKQYQLWCYDTTNKESLIPSLFRFFTNRSQQRLCQLVLKDSTKFSFQVEWSMRFWDYPVKLTFVGFWSAPKTHKYAPNRSLKNKTDSLWGHVLTPMVIRLVNTLGWGRS